MRSSGCPGTLCPVVGRRGSKLTWRGWLCLDVGHRGALRRAGLRGLLRGSCVLGVQGFVLLLLRTVESWARLVVDLLSWGR